MGEERFTCEFIACGKKGCKRCPHGPYWYGTKDEKGRRSRRYYGKKDPRTAKQERKTGAKKAPEPDWREPILNKATATSRLAYDILGVPEGLGADHVRSIYRRRAFAAHPDRTGDTREMIYLNAAYEFLVAVNRW